MPYLPNLPRKPGRPIPQETDARQTLSSQQAIAKANLVRATKRLKRTNDRLIRKYAKQGIDIENHPSPPSTTSTTGFSAESLKKFAVLTAKCIQAGALTFAECTAMLAEELPKKVFDDWQLVFQMMFDAELAKYQLEQLAAEEAEDFGEALVAIEEPMVEGLIAESGGEMRPVPNASSSQQGSRNLLKEMAERVNKACGASLSMETEAERRAAPQMQVTFVPARRARPEPPNESV